MALQLGTGMGVEGETPAKQTNHRHKLRSELPRRTPNRELMGSTGFIIAIFHGFRSSMSPYREMRRREPLESITPMLSSAPE